MILALGVDSDPTIVHFLRRCRLEGVDVEAINVREVALYGEWELSVPPSRSTIRLGDQAWVLEDFAAVYNRFDDLTYYQRDRFVQARWYGLTSALKAWLQTTSALVVNRPLACPHNSSKALHEGILGGLGFAVPPSVTTSDRVVMQEFLAGGPVVLKALCGTRADTSLVTDADVARYERSQGPVHLQRLVPGADVRAHVIGDAVVAVSVVSDAIDYRAARARAVFSRIELPTDLRERLVTATAQLGLSFAGWDFKVDDHGTYWCLEANPKPGYNMYDRRVDGEITRALLAHLGSVSGVTAGSGLAAPS
jgi:hypothetical protein